MTPISSTITYGTASSATPLTAPSVLKQLRALIPTRDCEAAEATTIAERQATRLLGLLGRGGTIGIEAIAELPRIRVVYEALPVSGMSHWNGRSWIITINRDDPLTRQRFTVLHEFKHIIDHGAAARLYRDTAGSSRRATAAEQAEQAADYFAGCALIPRQALKSVWGQGMQRITVLAEHFGVSPAAIEVRLSQTGLDRVRDPDPEPVPARTPRCARPTRTPLWQAQRFRPVYPAYARRSAA